MSQDESPKPINKKDFYNLSPMARKLVYLFGICDPRREICENGDIVKVDGEFYWRDFPPCYTSCLECEHGALSNNLLNN